MKKISGGPIVIGLISIGLSILNAAGTFLSLNVLNDLIRCVFPFSGSSEFIGLFLPYTYLDTLSFGILRIFPTFIFFIDLILPFISYLFSIVLIISGIGSIWLKPEGKIFAYIYARCIIFVSIIGIFIVLINYIWLPGGGILGASEWEVKNLVVGMYIIINICTLLYPIVLLIFFSRPKVKEKFTVNNKK